MEQLQQKWIMACIDDSPIGNAVVDYAAWIAQKVQSPLELVHTLEHGLLLEHTDHSGNLTPNMREHLLKTLSEEEQTESQRLIAEGKQLLVQAKQRLAHYQITKVQTKQRHGGLVEAVEDLKDEIRVLVLGVKGKSHHQQEQAIGEQIEAAIKALHKPILIVSGDFKEPRSMMLAFNATEGAQKALDMVCRSPLYVGMKVHLVHVTNQPEVAAALVAQASQKLQAAGVDFTTQILSGDAQTALLDYIQQHDLDMIMMGAFNHGKLHQLFFGSFTLKMLMYTQKPVLLLR